MDIDDLPIYTPSQKSARAVYLPADRLDAGDRQVIAPSNRFGPTIASTVDGL